MGGPCHTSVPSHVAIRTGPNREPRYIPGGGRTHEEACALCHYIRTSNHLGTKFVSPTEYRRVADLPNKRREKLMSEPTTEIAMLRRKIGQVGVDPPAPILHLPVSWLRLEGLGPGDEVDVAFDNGVLVVAPISRAGIIEETIRKMRAKSRGRQRQ